MQPAPAQDACVAFVCMCMYVLLRLALFENLAEGGNFPLFLPVFFSGWACCTVPSPPRPSIWKEFGCLLLSFAAIILLWRSEGTAIEVTLQLILVNKRRLFLKLHDRRTWNSCAWRVAAF